MIKDINNLKTKLLTKIFANNIPPNGYCPEY